MTRLQCIARYRSRQVRYDPGDELDVTPEQAAQLLADSPGSFAEIPAESTEPKAPPAPGVDKQIRQPKERKS